MTPTLPRKNRRWIWVFVVFFTMAILAVVILIAYNLSQQLKPEDFTAARKLWNEKGPRSYTMAYTIRRNDSEDLDRYVVKVHNGRVVSSIYNDRPEEPSKYVYRDMDALFDDIERFMKQDSEPGKPRAYVRAIFDEKTGGLRWYVHRVMGTRNRAEITVDSLTVANP
jgi:hypothetical protein